MKLTALIAAMLLSFTANAATAFFLYEVDKGNGLHKQCVYDLLGEEFVITIPAIKLCPLTIEV